MRRRAPGRYFDHSRPSVAPGARQRGLDGTPARGGPRLRGTSAQAFPLEAHAERTPTGGGTKGTLPSAATGQCLRPYGWWYPKRYLNRRRGSDSTCGGGLGPEAVPEVRKTLEKQGREPLCRRPRPAVFAPVFRPYFAGLERLEIRCGASRCGFDSHALRLALSRTFSHKPATRKGLGLVPVAGGGSSSSHPVASSSTKSRPECCACAALFWADPGSEPPFCWSSRSAVAPSVPVARRAFGSLASIFGNRATVAASWPGKRCP